MRIKRAPLRELSPVVMAQVQATSIDRRQRRCPVEQGLHCIIVLDVDRNIEKRGDSIHQFGQGDHRLGQIVSLQATDLFSTEAEIAIVVQDQVAIGAQPNIGLDACRPQFHRQIKGFGGVLRRMASCPTMCKSDWTISL